MTTSDASGISYLVSDGLGSVTQTLSQTGTATGAQLYSPYGGVRYSSGTMPTAKGFTGQYADGSTGLDYYGARYYDPALGQFTSADTVADGLNRYAYVKGNPETFTDPSGHRLNAGDGGSSCVSLLDCGILTFGGNVSIDKSGDINVGDGDEMHIDPHHSQSPKKATSVYRWCYDRNHCVDAVGYSGKQLEALIKANQGRLANDQAWLKRIQDYIAEISFGVGVATMAAVAAVVFLMQLAAMPEDGVPPDVRAAISAGSTAGGWTGSGVAAALEATEHWLEADISVVQTKLAQENRAAQIGGTLWYVGATMGFSSLGGYVSMGGYWVIDDGTMPGVPVKNAVANVLSKECAGEYACQ